MKAITYKQIQIEGGLGITRLLDFSMCIKPNCHAVAHIKGETNEEGRKKASQIDLETHVVKVYLLDDLGNRTGQPFFSGYLKEAALYSEGDYGVLELIVYSGTILLDREKKCKSFQDLNKSYSVIVKNAIADTQQAAAICTIGQDAFPKKPLIQYRETNWEYALRLASHFNSVIYPEVKEPRPWFWFGWPNENGKVTMKEVKHTYGLSKHFYELGGSKAGWRKQDFYYYKISTIENIELGTVVYYKGEKWNICQKESELIQDELIFSYILGKPELMALKKKNNLVFAGMTILGKVLKTGGETVKLHLDIDKEQEVTTAYPYEWTPDTGSTMYCMPKVGTTVALYFSNSDEQSAQAVSCIRENGATCSSFTDPSKRALTTEHGKQMLLNPDSLEFSVPESGNYITLQDASELSLKSENKIVIEAKERIDIRGKSVILETPTNFQAKRKPSL